MLVLIFLILNILRYMKVYAGIWMYMKVYGGIWRYMKSKTVYEGIVALLVRYVPLCCVLLLHCCSLLRYCCAMSRYCCAIVALCRATVALLLHYVALLLRYRCAIVALFWVIVVLSTKTVRRPTTKEGSQGKAHNKRYTSMNECLKV